MRQLPHLQDLHDRFAERGLHVLLVESQHHDEDEVRAFLGERAITVPSAILDWSDFPLAVKGNDGIAGYDPAHLPRVYLIGVDGTVITDGTSIDDARIEAELARVKYPGLKRTAVTKELEPAAAAFGKREYAAAAKLAKKQLEGSPTDTVRADAEHLLARLDAIATRETGRAEALATDRRFGAARAIFERLAREFEDDERGKAARARVDALKQDKDAVRGAPAEKKLAELLQELRSSPRKIRAEKLAAFAKEHEGTIAADDAAAFAARASAD